MGELESIRVFLAVVEQQSFAGAARQLGLTPASVTRTIAALEDRLGVQLLVRTTRQVSLTAAGAVYAARVAPLAEGMAEAAQETREAQGITSGLIRVSAPISMGMRVLPAVLSQFATLYPQTHVALSLSDSFVDIVEEDYDLAIRISGPPEDKSTIWRRISPVPRVLVAAPSYLTAHGTPGDPGDLAGHICLSYRSDARDEVWELSKGPSRRSHRATGRFSANNGDVLARLVLNGEGIALLPRFIVEEDLDAGRLAEVLPDWSSPEIWLTLYYPPYARLPLKVATFSDFFETFIKEIRPL
ncbi:LysR family transcriptional regulator [Paracoccus sp. (in: a-proteobacteria)]|uniref:LysR family transcriptional regulator n=1 Tax=Paracoccus sp. TaxID=267 RepID=UPI0026E0EFF4|nr:LysR family transcriptional regulator [Paracoccus sp. (in: a-proteobacteria)]MDO5371687.1 LysR family transcriptional regulator [Paracoccus sp. (in: a-proteobacteria)]